jgi:hypothetical protein
MTVLAPCEFVTVAFPLTCSEASGLKVTFSVALCPALTLSGVVIPLAEKSFPLTLICEMVIVTLPVLAMVTLFELELPTLTEVKLKLLGVVDMVTVPATPVPLSATTVGELGALLEMLTLPDSTPAVFGANTTLNVALWPADNDAGVLGPVILKPVPLSAICATVNVAVPVFVKVKVCDLACPLITLPKL